MKLASFFFPLEHLRSLVWIVKLQKDLTQQFPELSASVFIVKPSVLKVPISISAGLGLMHLK